MKKISPYTLGLIVASLMLAGGFLFFTGAPKAKAAETPKAVELHIVNYGSGIYSFPWTGDEYYRRLSDFKTKNPQLEFVSAEPEIGSSQMGWIGTMGHTVYFREKK